MVKRLMIMMCFVVGVMFMAPRQACAGVNFDYETIAAMTSGYASELGAEYANGTSIDAMMGNYTSAEVATAGIFASKWLDRKAMTRVGSFGNANENYFYKRIYQTVSMKIMPKLLEVGALVIKHPDKALYWGPYLFNICEQTRQLCMQFETVVCNGKVNFQDVAFLCISEQLQPLFDLAKLGQMDWAGIWEHITEFGDGLTKDDLMGDLNSIVDIGGNIASSGASVFTDAWGKGSKVGNVFKMKPDEILDLAKEFKSMYETFSKPQNVINMVKSKISGGVEQLFDLKNYNIGEYLTDYVAEFKGQYYMQEWRIVHKDSGRELVNWYSPPSDIVHSGEWYIVFAPSENYHPSSDDIEKSLKLSENYAGFSRSYVNSLNNKDSKYVYKFENYLQSVYVTRFIGISCWGFAHELELWRSWNVSEVVYSEDFDSQTMSEGNMKANFNARLMSLNDNEEGKVYVIEKGPKRYYQAAEANKLKDVSTVSFTLDCHDTSNLAEGNVTWYVNESHDHGDVRDDSRRYAMATSLSSAPSTSELDQQVDYWSNIVIDYENQIKALEDANKALLNKISSVSIEEAMAYREQYNINLEEIKNLRNKLENAQSEYNTYFSARQEVLADFAAESDDKNRIPSVMHELEKSFSIKWADAGSWQGNTFVRMGNVPKITGQVRFEADLKCERGEKWLINFFGIKIIRLKRAVLSFHWKLIANYASNSVADIINIEGKSAKEKEQVINNRIRELMTENPGCTVTFDVNEAKAPNTDDDEDPQHLLWMDNRLKIAMDIDYRLSKIYAQLLQLEKFYRSRDNLIDYFKYNAIQALNGNTSRSTVGGKSLRMWMKAAHGAAEGKKPSQVLQENKED